MHSIFKTLALFSFCFFSLFFLYHCQKSNVPPTCKITSPAYGTIINKGDEIKIAIDATDEDGIVADIHFYLDDTGIGSTFTFPYSYLYKTDKVKTGFHILKATVFDADGATASDTVTIKVVENVTKEDQFDVLKTYLANNSLDLDIILNGWIIYATTLYNAGAENYYIIDIRDPTDFAKGHIMGAKNSSMDNILNVAANAGSKSIVVVSYTGHASAYAITALRLSGYNSAVSLTYGMSSWHDDFDDWSSNAKDFANIAQVWANPPGSVKPQKEFSKPQILTTLTDEQDILKERVNHVLSTGFEYISGSDILKNPSGYFINAYMDKIDIEQYGNIKNAYNIKNNAILSTNSYKFFDPNSTIVSYEFTGQTSALVSAYLKVLGYNTVGLKFGLNGLIYSNLASHKWKSSANFPYEK